MNTAFVLLGLVVLLVLATIRVRPGGRTLGLVAMVVAGLAVGVVGMRGASAVLDYYPDSWAMKLAKTVSAELADAAADPGIKDVIIVEGSSYSARGLDGPMLARLLTRGTGHRTAIIQLTLDGANHFERSWILSIALERLGDEGRAMLREKQVTLLMEIQRGYDFAPLNGFLRNRGSDRTYAYMTVGNGWDGLRANWSLGARATEPMQELAPAVASHVALNALQIGMAHRGVTFEEVKPIPGFQPLNRAKRGYRHRGTGKVLEVARQLDSGELAPAHEKVRWVDTIRRARYLEMLDGLVDREAYFSVPSTEAEDLLYVAAFCAPRTDIACITYGDPALLKRLDRRADWNDRRHMRVGGTEKFTRWFARRYLRDMGRIEAK